MSGGIEEEETKIKDPERMEPQKDQKKFGRFRTVAGLEGVGQGCKGWGFIY